MACSCCLFPASGLEPGEAIDYKDFAFYPDRWVERKVSTKLFPWEGEQVVFFTVNNDQDPKVMARILDRLDGGWAHYKKVVGRSPRSFKLWNGKPFIAAVPDGGLTCGAGCGRVGTTGIEVSYFYARDYQLVAKQPDAFAHYYFYEMGRNYFVFGNRHSEFTTGFAVLMRYVCMDALKCVDPEAKLREQIESAEAVYAKGELSFLDAFTVKGRLSEKQPRLRGFSGPSDQPVMYTSAMLKLREDHGGDEFLADFFKQLQACPSVRPTNARQAMRQCVNWLVAASCAAGEDLTPTFVDRWRMPLTDQTRKAMSEIDWSDEKIDAGIVIESIDFEFEGLNAE